MNHPHNWEENIQVILDLLSTPDGRIAKSQKEINTSSHIPIYETYDDIYYYDTYHIPRLLLQPFRSILELLYNKLYQKTLEVEIFGKPSVKVYKYLEQVITETIDMSKYEISNYYMIGDLPSSDIRGANQAGWSSILVKTGVFKGDENDKIDPAKYIVDDFSQAIKLIFQLESIKSDL